MRILNPIRNRSYMFNVNAIVQYFFLFVIATIHGTVYWSDVWRDIPLKPAIIFFIVFIVWCSFRLSLHKFLLIYILLNIAIHGIDGLVQENRVFGSEAVQAVMPFLVYIFLVWVFYKLNPQKALTRFVKFVAAISLFSVVCFTIQIIIGLEFFSPISQMLNGRGLYGFFLYSVATHDILRNYGIFGEPGIYQIIVNVAIFIMLFWKRRLDFSNKMYTNVLIVLIITLITINSTIGYIELMCIFGGVVIKGSKTLKKRIGIVIIIMCIAAIGDFVLSGDESIIMKNLINKIIAMSIGDYAVGFNEATSGGARLYILSIIAEAFNDSMLWGIGDKGLNNLLSLSATWKDGGTGNALGIYLIRRGLIPTIAVVLPILYRCYKTKESIVEYTVIVLMFFLTALAQSQIMYASYMLLAFGDICKNVREKTEKI